MKINLLAFAVLAAASTFNLQGQVTTEPVGFNTVTCLAGSDTRLSVPLCPETAFIGTIGTATAGAGQATLTSASLPAWTASQFATSYYVKLTSGPKVGWFYQVLSNTSTDLVVDLAGDTLGIVPGDTFRICKYWTLASLFPPATQTTVVVSTNNLPLGRRTEIHFPDTTGAGINLSTSQIFFLTSTGWKKAVTGFPDASNTILTPDAFFTLRHGNAAIVSATTYTVVGGVDLSPNSTPLATLVSGKQDNPVTTGRPVPVSLAALDLVSSGFVASTNTLPLGRRDEILVYANEVAALNKSPSAIYFYHNGNWKKSVTGFPIADTDELPPSSGFLIRKYQTATGGSVIWNETF
jgi:uncharacterized protein (TIGR02597 family)